MSESTKVRIAKLRQLVALIGQTAASVIDHWETGTDGAEIVEDVQLPSHGMFEAQRTLIAALGSVEELVGDPSTRLLGFAMQAFESRALHVAVEHRVADLLDKHGGEGLHITQIARHVGADQDKLARLLRLLCSQHIYREVAPNVYANNITSQVLVGNEDLRAYIMLFAMMPFTSVDYLPDMLVHPKMGPSYKLEETAFNLAFGTDKSCWCWITEKAPASDIRRSPSYSYARGAQCGSPTSPQAKTGEELVHRPEIQLFGRAMFGAGKVFSSPLVYDYPWNELGDATVVDVGGGIGGFTLQVARAHPKLSFVIQDREGTVAEGRKFWAEKSPSDLQAGRVRLMTHDFFRKNPVTNADVYLLRYIMHDWSDDYCIKILSEIAKAMGPSSKVLIADQVMNTTLGSEDDGLPSAPAPLLANYGTYVRFSHQIDVALMATINGIERTPLQFKRIVEAAGLKIKRIIGARTQVSIVECVLEC